MKHNGRANDQLESFGICQLARRLFDVFWNDAELLTKTTQTIEARGRQP
jgi:hypothetical protein